MDAGDFLLLAQKKVTKEKGAPVRRRYLAKLVADSTALLDRPGRLRNSRTASTLAVTVGGRFSTAWLISMSSHSARPKPRAGLRCSGGAQGAQGQNRWAQWSSR